jgi:hypothetical protein
MISRFKIRRRCDKEVVFTHDEMIPPQSFCGIKDKGALAAIKDEETKARANASAPRRPAQKRMC